MTTTSAPGLSLVGEREQWPSGRGSVPQACSLVMLTAQDGPDQDGLRLTHDPGRAWATLRRKGQGLGLRGCPELEKQEARQECPVGRRLGKELENRDTGKWRKPSFPSRHFSTICQKNAITKIYICYCCACGRCPWSCAGLAVGAALLNAAGPVETGQQTESSECLSPCEVVHVPLGHLFKNLQGENYTTLHSFWS